MEDGLVSQRPNLNVISLIEVSFWRGNPRRPLRIVCKEKQALAGFVQPPNRCQPLPVFRHQRIDRRSALLVARAGNQSPRLIQHEIDFLNSFHLVPIDRNLVLLD
jgi:hypothetical protein